MAPLRDHDRLRNALSISNARLRTEAVKVLGDTEDEEIVDLLLQALRDPSRGVRAAAARRLKPQGAFYGCTVELLECLDDPADEVRAALVAALAEANFEEVDARLCELVNSDPSRFVRSAAVGALAGRGSDGCWRAMAAALWDSSWTVRTHAFDLLRASRDHDGTRRLLPLLASLDTERATALALALSHSPEPVVDAVAFAALQSPDPATRLRAVGALRCRDDEKARCALLEMLRRESDASVQITALRSLRSWQDERGAVLFRLLVANPDAAPAVRLEAARNLVQHRRIGHWRWLLDLAFDRGAAERRLAAIAFADIVPETREQMRLVRMAVAPEETLSQFCEACRWGELDFLHWYERRLARLAPTGRAEHLQGGVWAACRALNQEVAQWLLGRDEDAWTWIDAQFRHLLEAGEWETARFILQKLDLEGRVRIHLNEEFAFRSAWNSGAFWFAEFLLTLAPSHGPIVWGSWIKQLADHGMGMSIHYLVSLPDVSESLSLELSRQLKIANELPLE